MRRSRASKKMRRRMGLLKRLRRFVKKRKTELALGLAAGSLLVSILQLLLTYLLS